MSKPEVGQPNVQTALREAEQEAKTERAKKAIREGAKKSENRIILLEDAR